MTKKIKNFISELRAPENQDSVFIASVCSLVAYVCAVVPLVGR